MEFLSTLRAQWDRAGAICAVGLGLVVLLIGYVKISGTPYVAEQMPYIVSAGLIGLLLVVVGATLWLSADLRDEWRKLDMLDSKLDRAYELSITSAPTVEPTPPVPARKASARKSPSSRRAATPKPGS